MGDLKTSQLPIISAITGAEIIAMLQSGTLKIGSVNDLLNFFNSNQDLAQILTNGNQTGGTPIIILDGDYIGNPTSLVKLEFNTISGTDFAIKGNGTTGGYFFVSPTTVQMRYGTDAIIRSVAGSNYFFHTVKNEFNAPDNYFPLESANKLAVFDSGKNLKSGTLSESQIATISYVDGLVAGLLDDRGSYDASSNLFPSSGGSGVSGAILKGDMWYISVAGTLGGQAVTIGDSVRALVDTPGQTSTNWSVLETNIGYVPENVVNKATTMTGNTGSNVVYLTAKAIYDWAVATFQEIITDVTWGAFINGLTAKTTPVDADYDIIMDSADSNKAKKVSWANRKAALNIWTSQKIQITTSSAPTINTGTFNRTFVDITAQASAINLSTNLSGTPQNGDILWYQIKDNGTARAITPGSLFENKGAIIPSTTIINKRINIGCSWDSTTSKYGCIAAITET